MNPETPADNIINIDSSPNFGPKGQEREFLIRQELIQSYPLGSQEELEVDIANLFKPIEDIIDKPERAEYEQDNDTTRLENLIKLVTAEIDETEASRHKHKLLAATKQRLVDLKTKHNL